MRAAIALLLTASPALVHPGPALHLHDADGFWITGFAFVIGAMLTGVVVVKAVRARK